MSYNRTITLTKTEQSPANAFDLYPSFRSALSAEDFAAFNVAYPRERTVEIVGDSMIITLVFSSEDIIISMTDQLGQVAMRDLKQTWIDANFIVETVDHRETV